MNKKFTTFFALVLLFAAVITSKADTIDDIVKAEMQKQRIPGLSLAVIKDGQIVKSQGYGLANVELNVPATPQTVYKIASVSKQFIAAGILLLVQENKISLDDKISKFLEGTPDTWKEITIRHLLTHTAGLVREAPGFDPFKIQKDADVIKTAYASPLIFAPGERSEYSNTGYFALAEIIRVSSGKPWEDYLNERLFKPLEMNSTRTTTMTEIVQNRANGYVWRNDKLQNSDINIALRPSGAFLSNVVDLAKWDAALYTDKIINQALRNEMWSPAKLNNGRTNDYGFGWFLDKINGHKLIRHGGSLPGFRSEFGRFVDDKISIVIMANGDNADLGAITVKIADSFIPNLIPKRTAKAVDSKILDTYAGQYQPNPSVVLTITREDGKLIFQQGSNKQVLLPENETDFFNKDNPFPTYRFIKNEQGEITHLTVQVEGREVARARKIK